MTAFIEQYFGLGDVIWAQSIAHHFINRGYTVLWPVEDKYFEGCRYAYPNISFFPQSFIQPEWFQIKDKRLVGDIQIVPIRWSDSYMQVQYKHVMAAKYMMYDLPWESWREHGMWVRNPKKEMQLIDELGIDANAPFNLVNKRFGSSGERSVNIQVSNSFKNIEMREVPGYSLFDWTAVMFLAEEIHTVSTSILYMLELLPIKKPIHLYVREGQETDFSFVDFIFTKPYILHL